MIKNHPLMKTEPPDQLQMDKLRTPEYRTKCVMRASLDDIALGVSTANYRTTPLNPHLTSSRSTSTKSNWEQRKL